MKRLKPASHSCTSRLTDEERATLEHWLFERRLSYEQVTKRGKRLFKVNFNNHALVKFYQETAERRIIDRIIASRNKANGVVQACAENPAQVYQAVLEVVGQIAFDKAVQSPDQLEPTTIRDFVRLLISARHEELDVQRFRLEREKWEFDVARACVDNLAQLQAITADTALDEDARLQAVRRQLFGENLPE